MMTLWCQGCLPNSKPVLTKANRNDAERGKLNANIQLEAEQGEGKG